MVSFLVFSFCGFGVVWYLAVFCIILLNTFTVSIFITYHSIIWAWLVAGLIWLCLAKDRFSRTIVNY